MIDLHDIEELKKHFDDRYVLVDDCNDIQKDVSKKFANDDKRISTSENTLKLWGKLAWVAVSALVAEVALSLFDIVKSFT